MVTEPSPASATDDDGDQQDKDITMVTGREMIGSALLGVVSVCPETMSPGMSQAVLV